MLGLAHVQLDVLCLRVLPDDHAGIDALAGADEQCASFLGAVKSVSHGFACLEGDERPLLAVLDIALVRRVSVEACVQDPVSFCISEEFTSVSDQSSGRDGKFQTCVSPVGSPHVPEFALALPAFLLQLR